MQEAQIKHSEVLTLMASSLMEILEPWNDQKEEEHINIIKNLLYLVRWEKTQSGKKSSRFANDSTQYLVLFYSTTS